MYRVVLSFALVVLLPNLAAAVLIASGDGTGNTTAPANDPGFANVVSTWVRTGSAVYLGNGWMLTDDHVGAGPTYVNNVLYNVVPGSVHEMLNAPGTTFTTDSDVLLYQINGRPALPSLQIGASAPQFNQPVIMIGNGRTRGAAESWNVNMGEWTQAAPAPSVAYSGFNWGNTNVVSWGTNTVDSSSFLQGNGSTSDVAFSMSFSATNATTYEAIGTAGDSGGGVFSYNASTHSWQLIGLMESYTQFTGEPISVSVFGNATYAIQLSTYRNQIMSYLVPGDVNGDGRVDIQDITLVANNWMTHNIAGDANHDGIVDINDLTYIANDWGGVAAGTTAVVVPEPEAYALAISALVGAAPLILRRFNRRRSRARCGSRSSV